MGDDLYIAREFSNAALADISVMLAMETRNSNADVAQMSAKLARVQSGAKQLRARGIYQSAQIVVEGLSPAKISDNDFHARLAALSRLVTQYSDGLSEVETALSQDTQTQEPKVQHPVVPQAVKDDVSENIIDIPTPLPEAETVKAEITDAAHEVELEAELSDTDKQAAARAVLTELMPLTRDGETTPLQALLDYDPNAQESLKPELQPKLKLEPVLKPAQRPSLQVPLEYVLRDAIQDALSIARMSGKTISISYDVGQEHIGQNATNSLGRRLCDGLRALILQSLPQDGVGHIDINLRGKDMVIGSKHKLPRLLPQGLKSRKTTLGCEITLPLIVKREAAPLEQTPPAAQAAKEALPTSPLPISPLPISPLPIPMITDETEQKLRAQLGALMGAQNLNEELHMDDNIIVMTDEAAKKSDTRNTGGIGAGI